MVTERGWSTKVKRLLARHEGSAPGRGVVALCALLLCGVIASALPGYAAADQASEPREPAAGRLDVGATHTCALLEGGNVRCWGFGADGQLGYGNPRMIGDDETPGSVGPVDLGVERRATAISVGDSHTCALLDDRSVQCWGFGINGRLGHSNEESIGDNEVPGLVAPVDLGGPAMAIAAGGGHTCAVLMGGDVRCWGYGGNGQLGYGDTKNIGDNETPGSHAPVKLGAGRHALAITAGELHTCALLDDHTVRCWGYALRGELGFSGPQCSGANPGCNNIGDNETPDMAAPVNLGAPAVAISAGDYHTCALLQGGNVRCWGFNQDGELGYGNVIAIGDDPGETPDTAGPVNLGGHSALAITAGGAHTCARLEDQSVRCWGEGADGRLGYGNTAKIGDTPASTPNTTGPVDLGAGRKAVAISAGPRHTCARLDGGGAVRCWGYGGDGRLGYCNERSIGDDETPGAVGPVDIGGPGGGAACSAPPRSNVVATAPAPGSGAKLAPAASSDAVRARGLRTCLAAVAAHARREQRLARHGSARHRARARRHLSAHAHSGRRRCLRLFRRTPGRVTGLRARTIGRTQIALEFNAAGTDGTHPPPARSYVVKQALGPIRSARQFARARTLCKGACRFTVSQVGGKVTLAVTDLRPHTTYYYAVAARDNVSSHRGPSSQVVKTKTR